MRFHGCVWVWVRANLFDIVNTGQHPDSSVVEDGEFFCQFLLAGLNRSPRHFLLLLWTSPVTNGSTVFGVYGEKGRKSWRTQSVHVAHLQMIGTAVGFLYSTPLSPAYFLFFFYFFGSRGWGGAVLVFTSRLLRSRTGINAGFMVLMQISRGVKTTQVRSMVCLKTFTWKLCYVSVSLL